MFIVDAEERNPDEINERCSFHMESVSQNASVKIHKPKEHNSLIILAAFKGPNRFLSFYVSSSSGAKLW